VKSQFSFCEFNSEILVGKPKEKRLLGRSKLRWQDNIKMDLEEIDCGLGSSSLG
jgi:hypothetical protein